MLLNLRKEEVFNMEAYLEKVLNEMGIKTYPTNDGGSWYYNPFNGCVEYFN